MTRQTPHHLANTAYAPQIEAAVQAAQDAGQLIRANFDSSLTITTKKEYRELVTNLDLQSERIIFDRLAGQFAQYNFVSEEKGSIDHHSTLTWVIDPLDGTHNLTLGLPLIGVSIALIDNRQVVAGVINHVMPQHIYAGERGCGAFVDNRAVHVSELKELGEAKVGHIVSFEEKLKPRALNLVTAIRRTCRRMLDTWAPSLEWALLAHGKIDALVSLGSGQYDRMAGMLLVREAGGLITDFDGNPIDDLHTDYLLASNNTGLHASLLELIRIHYGETDAITFSR
jgi:myo-inositol-1(or 4)-monophosphatase